jgi:hypothetical protein
LAAIAGSLLTPIIAKVRGKVLIAAIWRVRLKAD